MDREIYINLIEDQSEEDIKDVQISDVDQEALLYKYYPELFKDKKVNVENDVTPTPPEELEGNKPRINGDLGTQQSNKHYHHVKYDTHHLDGGEMFNIRIDINTDMELY